MTTATLMNAEEKKAAGALLALLATKQQLKAVLKAIEANDVQAIFAMRPGIEAMLAKLP